MNVQRVLLGAGLVMSVGCYSYLPTRVESVAPGQEVRIRLTPEQVDSLVEVRRSTSPSLEGTILQRNDGELTIDTHVTRQDPLSGQRALLQTLDLPLDGIVQVELREPDRMKTGLLVGGLVVGTVLAVITATSGEGGSQDPNPPPGPPESRIPVGMSILRFALPFF